jgi:hypothetical protein
MAPSTFIQVLKTEVARMGAAHPEREGDLARACALIANGMVTPSVDDPGIGRVLSSDLQTTYTVNGACDCPAGSHGKPCKHRDSWRLFQYIERKVAAQEAQETTEEFGGIVAQPPRIRTPLRLCQRPQPRRTCA